MPIWSDIYIVYSRNFKLPSEGYCRNAYIMLGFWCDCSFFFISKELLAIRVYIFFSLLPLTLNRWLKKIIRIHKSKTDGQHNVQRTKDKQRSTKIVPYIRPFSTWKIVFAQSWTVCIKYIRPSVIFKATKRVSQSHIAQAC
jgi:hypothetical protein